MKQRVITGEVGRNERKPARSGACFHERRRVGTGRRPRRLHRAAFICQEERRPPKLEDLAASRGSRRFCLKSRERLTMLLKGFTGRLERGNTDSLLLPSAANVLQEEKSLRDSEAPTPSLLWLRAAVKRNGAKSFSQLLLGRVQPSSIPHPCTMHPPM